MKLTLTLDADNAAFDEDHGPGPEMARIVRKAADVIAGIDTPTTIAAGNLFDVNGNRVGRWEVS